MDSRPRDGVWRDRFRVRAYELDDRWSLRPASLCDYLQESAAAHAQALGVSVDALHPRGLTWVLSRLHVRVNAFPLWRQEVTVETWPSAVSDLFALRDFRVLDAGEALLAAASSSWMVIDLKKRKPVPLPDFILSIHHNSPGRALDDSFSKLPVPNVFSLSKVLEVRNADLDLNRHLNFVKSVALGLEAVPDEILARRALSDLEVSFRAEGRKGDRVVAKSGPLSRDEPLQLGHVLLREKDGVELARMASTWTPAGPVPPVPSRAESS